MELRAIHANCSGCGVCRQVCTLENFRELNPAKSLLTIIGRFPSPGDYRIRVCNQCGICAEACPEDAIQMVDGPTGSTKRRALPVWSASRPAPGM
jgi:Pyruvate/2-oxoacid:ferredoxin oxidoreductase delta subunit